MWIYFFIVGIVVGGVVFWLVWRFWVESRKKEVKEDKVGDKELGVHDKTGRFIDYSKKQQSLKKERQAKILEILEDKGQISNNQVEKMFGVSDATATRYLEELEKQGKIKQVGGTGRGVYYVKA